MDRTRAAKGMVVAPQRVLRAVCKSGQLLRSFIIFRISFGVELFVARFGQAQIAVLDPNFHALPGEGIKTDFNEPAAQMGGHFPETAFQTEGGVESDATLSAMKKESLPVGVRISRAQADRAIAKALSRRLAFEGAMNSLMIFGF